MGSQFTDTYQSVPTNICFTLKPVLLTNNTCRENQMKHKILEHNETTNNPLLSMAVHTVSTLTLSDIQIPSFLWSIIDGHFIRTSHD